MVELVVYIIMLGATIFGASGSLLLKMGSNKVQNIKSVISNKTIIIGLVLFTLSTFLVVISLKFGELSEIFPMTALTYVWVAVLSNQFLKEKIGKIKAAGFLFIIIGILLITV